MTGRPTTQSDTTAERTTESRRSTERGRSASRQPATMRSLVGALGDDAGRLFQQEIALARAELREKAEVYERNLASIAVGALLLAGALFGVVVSINRGLTVLFADWLGTEAALWVSPLILSLVMAGAGWALVQTGQRRIRKEGLSLDHTAATLREETRWVKKELS